MPVSKNKRVCLSKCARINIKLAYCDFAEPSFADLHLIFAEPSFADRQLVFVMGCNCQKIAIGPSPAIHLIGVPLL